jgi:lipopolysaccharide export system permease protein
MKLLHSYLFCAWRRSFAVAFLAIVSLLLLEDVYRSFYPFIRAGVPCCDLLRYCGLVAVSAVPLVLPIAIFTATLFCLSRLHRSNEITAMSCAGFSILSITKPILLTSIALAAADFAFEAFASPMALDALKSFRLAVDGKIGANTTARKIGFFNRRDGRVWFLRKFNKLSKVASGVTVNCYDSNGGEVLRIFSKSAIFLPVERRWRFNDCSVTTFSGTGRTPDRVELFSEKTFENFTEPPTVMIAAMNRKANLSFSDALDAASYCGNAPEANVFLTKLHGTFANAAMCILVALLAIPFAVSGVRSNPMVSTAKASIFLALFILCDSVLAAISCNGHLSPPVAVWAMPVTALIFIVFLHRRIR